LANAITRITVSNTSFHTPCLNQDQAPRFLTHNMANRNPTDPSLHQHTHHLDIQLRPLIDRMLRQDFLPLTVVKDMVPLDIRLIRNSCRMARAR